MFGQQSYCQSTLVVHAAATKHYMEGDKKELCMFISLFHSNRLEALYPHKQGPTVSMDSATEFCGNLLLCNSKRLQNVVA